MPDFALAVPFPGLVEQVAVTSNLPPHVTVLVPSPGEVAPIDEVLASFEHVEADTWRQVHTFGL